MHPHPEPPPHEPTSGSGAAGAASGAGRSCGEAVGPGSPGDGPTGVPPPPPRGCVDRDRYDDQLATDHPVLDEIPLLGATLAALRHADQLLLTVVDDLATLDEHDAAAALTGVGLDQWLAIAGRTARHTRTQLLTTARACRRLPSLRAAATRGTVSYSQLTALARDIARIPTLYDDRLDAALADQLAHHDPIHDHPDHLTTRIRWTLDRHQPPDPPATATRHDELHLQPRLDGTGGTGHLDLGPLAFAALEAATDPGPPPRPTRTTFGQTPTPAAATAAGTAIARRRAEQLTDLCLADLDATHPHLPTVAAGPHDDPDAAGRPDDPDLTATPIGPTGHDPAALTAALGDPDQRAARRRRVARRPHILLRIELDHLLHAPRAGQLLTHLTGGAIHVDAATATRIADTHGAELRLIITDHGRPIGVGRRTRKPPNWLRDAVLALHDTCTEPGCHTAARTTDLDHAHPWDHGGPTDIDNLAPLCGTANHRKERDGWTARQHHDGSRLWHHPHTGLTTRTHPAGPPPPPPRPRRPDCPTRPPDRAPPPGRPSNGPTTDQTQDPTRDPTRDPPPP
jgi:hypothetical protein